MFVGGIPVSIVQYWVMACASMLFIVLAAIVAF